MDFGNGTTKIHLPGDESIWIIGIKNSRYEAIELPDDTIQYQTVTAHTIIDYIEDREKHH